MKTPKLADMSLEELADTLLSSLPDGVYAEVPECDNPYGLPLYAGDEDYIQIKSDRTPTILQLSFEDDEDWDGELPQGETWLACNVYRENEDGYHVRDLDAFCDWELHSKTLESLVHDIVYTLGV